MATVDNPGFDNISWLAAHGLLELKGWPGFVYRVNPDNGLVDRVYLDVHPLGIPKDGLYFFYKGATDYDIFIENDFPTVALASKVITTEAFYQGYAMIDEASSGESSKIKVISYPHEREHQVSWETNP